MSYRIIPAFALVATLASPVQAQSVDDNDGDGGRSLMERGAELFFEGLSQEMAPALNDLRGMAEQFGPSMQGFFEEMGPAFADILDEVKDWSNYHPPEILPNGDIILRRKVDPEGEDEKELPPSGPTDI
jgi:hypothetical protein